MDREKTNRLNWINSALMIASAAVALIAPFHVFLLAYAVLGPLHYLTEISWLHDRQYFTPRAPMRRLWLTFVAAAATAVAYGFVSSNLFGRDVAPTFEIALVYMAFFIGAAALFVKHLGNGIALAVAGALALAIAAGRPSYAIVAYLLITLIHVLLFTGCFVLFGALRSRSRSGLISAGVFAACTAACLVLPAHSIAPSTAVRAVYADFEQLNQVLLYLTGRAGADVYGAAAIAIMRLIAFGYLYHYLNWFSKTSIIRWHEVSRPRAAGIVTAWIGGVILYAVDYRIGFAVFYVLSVVHVMLEFPLNHQTLAGLARLLIPARQLTNGKQKTHMPRMA